MLRLYPACGPGCWSGTVKIFGLISFSVLIEFQVLLEAKNIKGEIKNGLDYDWVTVFDTKIENLLHEKIKEKYPSHKFIGEESSTEEITLTNDPTWIIDPIDGTENFIRKLRLSCISVALTVNQERVLGVVYNPYLDEMFTALKGQGAYLNGEKIHVSDQKGLTILACQGQDINFSAQITSSRFSIMKFPWPEWDRITTTCICTG